MGGGAPGTLASLRSALGADALEEHAAVDLDGVGVGATLRPVDADALGEALRALAGAGAAAVVRGGGSRLGLGHPPERADVFLSTERLTGVDDFDPGEGVCHARAGTPLAGLRAAANAEGWELPLDPPGAGSTVGGALAAAALGPRSLGLGLPRDAVLGLEVVLASGERTRCGGRVVKNVTGYDLNKLYTGSLGTLGVIDGAWLRLRPLPERVESREARVAGLREACRVGLLAARRGSARAVGLLVDPGAEAPDAARLCVELAGDAETVAHDEAALARETGFRSAPDVASVLRERQAAMPAPDGARFRIAVLPSRLAPTLTSLAAAGAALLAYPGLGLVYAGLRLVRDAEGSADAARPSAHTADAARPSAHTADAVFGLVARVAREGGGTFACEAAPAWAKRGRDLFDARSLPLALFAALKARFDPEGVLAPGRVAGPGARGGRAG